MTDTDDLIDPFALTRPEPVTETRTFTDFRQPGKKLTLTFRAEADYSVVLRVHRLAARYVGDFITGRAGKGNQRTRVPLRMVGNRAIDADEDLFYQIACLETLQHGPKRYDVFQWAALSVTMPTAFGEIVAWAGEMMEQSAAKPDGEAGAELPND